jgi:hypothetical protein
VSIYWRWGGIPKRKLVMGAEEDVTAGAGVMTEPGGGCALEMELPGLTDEPEAGEKEVTG